MRLQFRQYLILGAALVVFAICVRLGVWQLDRLQQRRAHNAMVIDRLSASPVFATELPVDTLQLRYRRAHVIGAYDYEHQFVLASRSRQGSPGVNIITPAYVAGSDSVVLVNRGWVYAPDGVRTDLDRWREGDSVDATGYIQLRDRGGKGAPKLGGYPLSTNAYRWFEPDSIRADLPYPIFPFIVALDADSVTSEYIPPRVPPPALDEGPHAGYAFQWFAFAIIFLSGAIVLVYLQQRALQDKVRDVEVDTDTGNVNKSSDKRS